MNILNFIFIFLLGLILGSFFNVCIYRIPNNQSINYPPSHCGSCNTQLKWYDLFPVLSWVFLKGKCRYCGAKVSFQYPAIELLTGAIFSVLFLKFGLTLTFVKYAFLCSILLISAVIDYKTQYVFFSVSLTGIIAGVVFTVTELFMGRDLHNVVLSIAIPLLIFGGIILLTKKFEGMGAGDLEIFIVIALFVTPKIMVVAIMLSILLGGAVSIVKLLKGQRGTYIAFVPYIALGTFIAILFSNEILSWYMSMFI